MIRRTLIVGALLAVGLPVVVVAAVLMLANTDWGRARIVAAVQSATAEGPVQVRIDRLTGPLPGRIGLEGLRLSDRAGEFAAFARIDLAWSPLALLGGVLSVQSVELAGGRVARAPDLPQDPTAALELPSAPSLAFPAPPLAVRVDAIRISGVELGEALAGRAATLGADLVAAVTGESATAAGWIEAASPDGTARLDLDLAVVPGDGTLRAEIRASEPQGGMVAGLLGLPGRPPLDLTLTGAGTLAGWSGRLVGGFGPGAAVDMALAVAGTQGGTRIEVQGSAAVQRLLPEPARPLAGRSSEVDVTVVLAADGAVAVESVALRTAVATLQGAARIDPGGVPVAADATLSVPDLRMLSGLAGVALSGAAGVRLQLLEEGRRAHLAATGSPTVAGTALDDLRVDLAASADRPLAGLPEAVVWSLDAAVATPALPQPDLAALLGPHIALQASGSAGTDGSRAAVEQLVVTTEAGRLDATATLVDGRRVEVRGTLAMADLRRLSAIAGRPLAGSAALGFDGTVLLDPVDVSAVVDLAAAGLDLGDPALADLVGAGPTLSAGVILDAQGRLAIHGLALRTATVQADGDAKIDLAGGGLDGRIDLAAPDLAAIGRALAVDLTGSARAAVVLAGTLDSPTASASWQAAPLVVLGTRVAELSGSATAVGLPARPSGRLDLRAIGGGETVTLGAGYAFADGALRIDGLALDGAGLRAGGDAVVALAGPAVDGELKVTVQDLGQLGAAAGLPLSGGSAEAAVTLAARDGQSARLTGRVRALALDGGATEIAEIELSGEGRALLSRPAGTLRATIGGVRRDGAAVLEIARLTARSDGAQARATLSLEGGAGDQAYTVTVTASAALDAAPPRASVETLQAEIAAVRIALSRPARITLGAAPRIDDLSLTVDGGRITGGGRIDPEDLEFTLAVRDLPARLARLADPTLKLDGGIDADLSVNGPLGDPTAHLTVSVPALRSADPALAEIPPLAASAEARVANRKLTASVDVSAGDGVAASLRATVGLATGTGGAPPDLDEAAPLQVRLNAEATLDRLSAFVPLDGGRIGGQALADVTVTGTVGEPEVSGSATLRDGVVEQPTVGLYLRDVTLDARGRGDRLVIETLTASAVGGGTLEGSGSISFDVAEGAPADMRLVARRLRAVDTDQAEIDLDAELSFRGALPEYRLAGTVTVLPSEIRIPDQLPPSVVELEVTEVRDGVVVRSPQQEQPEEEEGDALVVLDVTVSIPGQVFIRGRGLESEWGGELKVTGPADAPAVTGGLQVRRGQLALVGRNFEFRRGRVVFDGNPPEDPALDMLLVAEVAEILARVEVSGRAQDPNIGLSSEPALPEEEVLSRILFGSPRAQLSPLQALKLAQSAAVLSGRMGGGGITDTVRETLGVDTLDVDTGGEGSRGASLSVGKYVAPGVFLKLQQGLSGVGSKAVVEVELTDSISVETDVGADSQSRVGVNWKLDY